MQRALRIARVSFGKVSDESNRKSWNCIFQLADREVVLAGWLFRHENVSDGIPEVVAAAGEGRKEGRGKGGRKRRRELPRGERGWRANALLGDASDGGDGGRGGGAGCKRACFQSTSRCKF
ncbi:hypothetical protein M0804_002546 [Polistes exclamans]|nr:hypothetical protein M0804_002546 [Polistes exclamans]